MTSRNVTSTAAVARGRNQHSDDTLPMHLYQHDDTIRINIHKINATDKKTIYVLFRHADLKIQTITNITLQSITIY